MKNTVVSDMLHICYTCYVVCPPEGAYLLERQTKTPSRTLARTKRRVTIRSLVLFALCGRYKRQTWRSSLRPQVDVSADREADARPPHRVEVPLHGLRRSPSTRPSVRPSIS